ncbi:hypothetical protein AZSI13_27920 [Azospira sp. I13]|uniref:DUF4148 domain-containing protein n=1 Tax=Azospira sp. I13 TaxID=1765050 RepID=UPI000D417947|nr:DUF4148 domain-containing protein [Azospira sp. I13]GBG03465.1 hypothetical protein AZSI13_27920 [Azospira sp. I13]
MKTKQVLSITILCAGFVASGMASAESVIHSGAGGATAIYPSHSTGGKTTQQVQKELEEFKRNPVSADGQYRYVGGDQGWALVQHEYAYRDGKWQDADKLDHKTPKPSLEMTPEERKQRDELYRP